MKRAMRCLMTTVRGVGALVPMLSAGAQVRAADTVFVMSNNADRNEVIEFQRNANGTYERSRFDTFGRGTGVLTILWNHKGHLRSARTVRYSLLRMQAAAMSRCFGSTTTRSHLQRKCPPAVVSRFPLRSADTQSTY